MCILSLTIIPFPYHHSDIIYRSLFFKDLVHFIVSETEPHQQRNQIDRNRGKLQKETNFPNDGIKVVGT